MASMRWKTVAAVIALALVGIAVGGAAGVLLQRSRWNKKVTAEAKALLAGARTPPDPTPFAPEQLEGLPAPVRRYLELCGALTHKPVKTARLRHGGTFQPEADGPAFPIRGEQYFTADAPGFVWRGRIGIGYGAWIDGRDRFWAGEGSMLVKAVSSVTLADANGPKLDEASLQRLMGEMVWFPTVLLDDRFVVWEAVDERTATARVVVGETAATLTWHFGSDGLPEKVTAVRNRDVDGKSVPTPWTGLCADFRPVDGLTVPFRMEASWTLGDREHRYARFEVEELQYDQSEPW